MAVNEGPFEQLAIRRLLELLNHDGLVIPLLTLRQLRELEARLPSPILTAVEGLQEFHPSLDVRLAAGAIVERAG